MRRTIRILTMLEAESISGSAKAVLEYARQAVQPSPSGASVALSIAKFSRGPQPENILTRAIRDLGVPLHVIAENRRFDRQVIHQLHSVVTQEQPDIIWSNSVKSHFLVRWGGLHRRAKWVAFHHGYTSTDLKMLAYNQLDRWSLRPADRLLTVCRPFAAQLAGLGLDSNKIHVQHMPVRPFIPASTAELEQLRSQLGLQDRRILLSVGRLSREKGHLDLIQAFALIRQALPDQPLHLVLVGEGPERPGIEAACTQLGLTPHVSLVGQQDSVRGFYSMAALFILPSHSEGSPNVLLEAMSAEVPIVTTAVGGIPELVTDQQDASLTPSRNPAALAAAASALLQDETLRHCLVKNALATASLKTPEAYARSLNTVFELALV